MKNKYLILMIMLVDMSRLYKLYLKSTLPNSTGNLTTCITYLAMVAFVLFATKERYIRGATILLMASIVFEYLPVFASNRNPAFYVMSVLTMIASMGCLTKVIFSEHLDIFSKGSEGRSNKPAFAFVLLVVAAIIGVFLYWGRG